MDEKEAFFKDKDLIWESPKHWFDTLFSTSNLNLSSQSRFNIESENFALTDIIDSQTKFLSDIRNSDKIKNGNILDVRRTNDFVYNEWCMNTIEADVK